jgi:cell division protein FtsB
MDKDRMEKYRDADREEEAAQIPLSESQKKQEELEPIEGDEQDNPTLWDIATTHNVSYADAVPIQEDMRLKRDALKEACTLAEMRKDRTPLANMKKRAQEAEGELSIMKGIETNRVKEAQARCDHLQNELDRIKKENNDLFNRIADSLEVNESHQKMNGKLQERLTELEEENKKLHEHFDKKIDSARKAGL